MYFVLRPTQINFMSKVDLRSQSSSTRRYMIGKTTRLGRASHCCRQVVDRSGRTRPAQSKAPSSIVGEWLHDLPVASCGAKFVGEAVIRVAMERLVVNLCERHSCPCGAFVDAQGTHGSSRRPSNGRSICNQLNDLIRHALERANIPSVKETASLFRSSRINLLQ